MRRLYFCQNEHRRQAVRNPQTLNGIDYLEVLDQEAPNASSRQRTLLVRFFKPLPEATGNAIKTEHIRIEGGVRVTSIDVEFVVRAADAADLFNSITEHDELELYLTQPEPDHVLVIRTAVAGDFSPYRLCLVGVADGFDPILSCVEFFFKVECPSDFDPETEPAPPPQVAREPVIDYLAKDYASFRQLMLDRLSVLLPGWRERNPADLGMVLVETLAYAADYLSYHQDAVATEAYLGTARRRTSVRRHARLLDYPMHDGSNARAWVQFEVAADLSLPSGTRLLTRLASQPARIPTGELDRALAQRPLVFETMHDTNLHLDHYRLRFYTWGDEECCLPLGATRATLAGAHPALIPGDVLIFAEMLDPGNGRMEDADPAHRHAVRLSRVAPSKDPLFIDPDTGSEQLVTEIEWQAGDALPFTMCISTVVDGAPITDVSVARGNVVLADHGRTLEEALTPAPAAGRYQPRLQETDVTHAVGYDHERARGRPALQALVQDPRQSLPAVTLRQAGADPDSREWKPRRDLLNSNRFERHFVVEIEDDGRAALRFGDGQTFGQRPPSGIGLQATYRAGNGSAGNVGADAIAHVVTDLDGIAAVCNPIPASGGTDPESLEAVRLNAPQAFRIQERAVTGADYVDVVQRHPEVQRAAVTRRWTGSWHTMFVTVDRTGGRPVDPAFEAELRLFVERYRLAGQDLEIDAPRFVALDIAITACVAAGFFRGEVKRALLKVFSNRDLPDGRRGFFHPDNFTFGQAVYLSQVVATAMQVPGVRWVDVEPRPGKPNRFQRLGEMPRGEIEKGAIELGRLEIARLDNDPNAPENGKIEFFMEGGV